MHFCQPFLLNTDSFISQSLTLVKNTCFFRKILSSKVSTGHVECNLDKPAESFAPKLLKKNDSKTENGQEDFVFFSQKVCFSPKCSPGQTDYMFDKVAEQFPQKTG